MPISRNTIKIFWKITLKREEAFDGRLELVEEAAAPFVFPVKRRKTSEDFSYALKMLMMHGKKSVNLPNYLRKLLLTSLMKNYMPALMLMEHSGRLRWNAFFRMKVISREAVTIIFI